MDLRQLLKRRIARKPEARSQAIENSPTARIVEIGKDGFRASVDDAFTTPRVRQFIESGAYEAAEIAAASAMVSGSDRVLELGAGIGVMSAATLMNASPEAYFAVEADPRLIAHIERTHALNGVTAARVINAVFSSNRAEIAHGRIVFQQSRAFWGSSLTLEGDLHVGSVEVEVMDASQFIEAERISVLICDIEGGERDLFRHLQFGGIRKVILEVHPRIYGKAGTREVLKHLEKAGFVQVDAHSSGAVACFER